MIFLLAELIVGCAAPAEHPALDQALATVERARGAPRVRALAPAELDLAEVALENARAAARAGAPPGQVEHLAYVVRQRAALAEARAAERVARSEIGKLQRAFGQALAHGRLEHDGQTRAPLRDDPQGRAIGQVRLPHREGWAPSALLDQRLRPAPEEHQRQAASADPDQRAGTAEPEFAAAPLEKMPEDVTLRVARLPFAEAEPTSEALAELAGLAQRLLDEPGRGLIIEADFDLPEPEARTLMERRIEVVRAVLLERGVAPARLIVRAGGDGPAEPEAASPSLERRE